MNKELNCAVGIDLGSTTTKAILLDENHQVLGRGITNSRSNYDVACAVARGEAFVDARINLLRRGLIGDPETRSSSEALLPAIERAFRQTQHQQALGHLYEHAAADAHRGRYKEFQPLLGTTLDAIFERMQAEVSGLYAPGSERQFFRDLASSSYAALATERADRKHLPFDVLMGIYDKSILVVENLVLEFSFGEAFLASLDRQLQEAGLDAEECARVRKNVGETAATEIREVATVGTGYGRARLPFPKENIRSEILCHGLGAHTMFPHTATVLDIGGQDTKAIQVDKEGIVTSFHMNDRCAAGCGRYLGYIADEMNLGLHELGPLALQASRKVKINSTCTVFAGAELRERLSLGQRREDILAGLHRAIILRAMSLLARAGGVDDEFTFTGGVARNQAAVQALTDLVTENYGERKLNISPESIYTGALGAALFAWRTVEQGTPRGDAA